MLHRRGRGGHNDSMVPSTRADTGVVSGPAVTSATLQSGTWLVEVPRQLADTLDCEVETVNVGLSKGPDDKGAPAGMMSPDQGMNLGGLRPQAG